MKKKTYIKDINESNIFYQIFRSSSGVQVVMWPKCIEISNLIIFFKDNHSKLGKALYFFTT